MRNDTLLLEALMKRMAFSPRAALLGIALLSGCAEPRSPTAPIDPAATAFIVERGPTEFGGGFDDGSRVLFAGLTLENLTNLFCEAPFDLDQLSALAVIRPDGSVKEQLRGGANVVVLLAPPEVALTCEGLGTAPHLTGTARVIVNDNDVDGSHPGAGAFQFHVVGTVTDESGKRFHLTAYIQGVFPPGSSVPSLVRTKIQLTRVGR
jgi:hypothetical protein